MKLDTAASRKRQVQLHHPDRAHVGSRLACGGQACIHVGGLEIQASGHMSDEQASEWQ